MFRIIVDDDGNLALTEPLRPLLVLLRAIGGGEACAGLAPRVLTTSPSSTG